MFDLSRKVCTKSFHVYLVWLSKSWCTFSSYTCLLFSSRRRISDEPQRFWCQMLVRHLEHSVRQDITLAWHWIVCVCVLSDCVIVLKHRLFDSVSRWHFPNTETLILHGCLPVSLSLSLALSHSLSQCHFEMCIWLLKAFNCLWMNVRKRSECDETFANTFECVYESNVNRFIIQSKLQASSFAHKSFEMANE